MNEQERRRRIAEAAYYRSERRGFAGNKELEDWLEAERELDAQNEPIPASGGMSQADAVGEGRELLPIDRTPRTRAIRLPSEMRPTGRARALQLPRRGDPRLP
jgi:hypothetical protein